ncbi:hypothetical protein [Proteiniborus sp.]
MKVKIAKFIGFCFIILSIIIVSYFCYQNYNSAKDEPKRAKLVINIE